MKKFLFLPIFGVVLIFCGCASSERMARLSGGVVQEYSAPQDHRLRSMKYQAKTRKYAKKQGKFAEKSLVNIWPFFYRSDSYFSILWPFVDFDPYGMAVRPFYNHEGDDYSILFPLTNWNTADKDGWALLAYWGPEKFGIFPLAHHSFNKKNGSLWYTPLLIRTWEYCSPDWKNKVFTRERTFTEFLLGWKKRIVAKDMLQYDYLYWKDYSSLKERLAFEFEKPPRNQAELDILREKIFSELPLKEENSFGFFPLFYYYDVKNKPDIWEFNLGGLLLHSEKTPTSKDFRFLGGWGLAVTERKFGILDKQQYQKEIFSLPLLSGVTYKDYYVDTPEWRSIQKIETLSYRKPFSQFKSEIATEYTRLTGEKMPPELCTGEIVRLWLECFTAQKKLPLYREKEGGFLPFFSMKSRPDSFSWFSLALLSGYEKNKDKSILCSIPLLVFSKETPEESALSVGASLIYHASKKRESRIEKPVFSRDTYWTEAYQQFDFEDRFGACGLYYYGRDGFSVAKKGVDAKAVEDVRNGAWGLRNRYRAIQNNDRRIKQLELRNRNWKTASRLEELKKAVAVEEVRLQRETFNKEADKFNKEFETWRKKAKSLGFDFSLDTLEKKFDASLEQLLERCTEVRYSEDFGSGLFFRKELAANGDNRWHAFLYLASGEKNGSTESAQVLQFLYRYTRAGEREEKLIFPFISIQKNKDSERFSFLWRLFETHSKNGKKGGYIFFIPWGE